MAEQKIGYRALPSIVNHPSQAKIIHKAEFSEYSKKRIEEAPTACTGHTGTIVWYVENEGYIIQVQLESKSDIFVRSACTYTPTKGMDQIDGEFAQDVEAYILNKELGCKFERLNIFDGKDSVAIKDYLEERGYAE